MTDRAQDGGGSRSTFRVVGWVVAALVAVGALVFLVNGADRPKDPVLRGGGRERVEGFGQIAYRVNALASARRCALLAENDQQRARGLMQRTDLAGHDGMLFVFPQEHQPSFFMKDTLIPLSVAFIDSEGYIVDIQDMQPLDLTQHRPPKPAKYALEVNQGFFEERGIQVGNRVDLPEWPYSAGRSSSTEVVQAFREAGLEVGESYPVEQEPGWEELPVPKTYEEATRFEILSIGEDSGGRVFVFESERDLAAVRDYYAGLMKPIRPHLYVEGDVLVEINHRLPEPEAAKYGAVLKVSNIQSRQ